MGQNRLKDFRVEGLHVDGLEALVEFVVGAGLSLGAPGLVINRQVLHNIVGEVRIVLDRVGGLAFLGPLFFEEFELFLPLFLPQIFVFSLYRALALDLLAVDGVGLANDELVDVNVDTSGYENLNETKAT